MLDKKNTNELLKSLKSLITLHEAQIKASQAAVSAAKAAMAATQLANKGKSNQDVKKLYPKVEISVAALEKQLKVGYKLGEQSRSATVDLKKSWKATETDFKLSK